MVARLAKYVAIYVEFYLARTKQHIRSNTYMHLFVKRKK